MFRIIEPEVAGGLGSETQLDNTVHPPLIKKLHFVFEGWLGDDIIETFPCFLVTRRLMEGVVKRALTGISFDVVQITKSPDFMVMNSDVILPEFCWAKINGTSTDFDFFLANDHRLVISERVYELFKQFKLKHALLEEWL